MNIVIAHDSITQLGGAERVAFEFHALYPEAPFFTIVVDSKHHAVAARMKAIASPLQKLYEFHPKLQHWLVLIPWAVENLAIPPAEVVLSSSSSFIKGLRKPAGSIHIDYCHTPTRFLWIDEGYVNQEVPALIRPLVKQVLKRLRIWDQRAAQRVDYFIANSHEVQKRIKQIYKRDSEVIYPYIDEQFWKPTRAKGDYFLIAGRLQPHKGNDVVIKAFNQLGLPLHVVGVGRQEQYLKSIAKDNITFLHATDEQLRDEYSGARGFIYPQFEDLGLMPIEAAACGTATLGLAKGGSLETIVPGITGELIPEVTVESVMHAVKAWNEHAYDRAKLLQHTEQFSRAVFDLKITQFVAAAYNKTDHEHSD